jgi:hypothetical protein
MSDHTKFLSIAQLGSARLGKTDIDRRIVRKTVKIIIFL